MNLDLSDVNNGILYERGYPWAEFEAYQGTILSNNATTMMDFGFLYASLYSMVLDPSDRLPNPDSYRLLTDDIEIGEVIPLSVIHYDYYKMDENSLNDNLFTYSNGQLFDVPGRPHSPYEEKEVFLIAPATNYNYVNVLNHLTSTELSNENYVEMFYLEMDKAHLFHLLGRTDLALSILYNAESCGLDYKEQEHLNDWKYIFESELAKLNYGPDADLIDTVWVDTNTYLTPVNQSYGEFGSHIVNQNTITFFNCSNPKAPLQAENIGIPFSIYPNPTNGILNATYYLPENSSGEIVIYGMDGKEIYRLKCQTGNRFTVIDISEVQSGIYSYSYIIDETPSNKGKIVVQH